MHLTWLIKLHPNGEETHALRATVELFNAACNPMAATAWRKHTANKNLWHMLVYQDIRTTCGWSAPMTVRAISKVAEPYKRDKTGRPTFRPHGSIIYD